MGVLAHYSRASPWAQDPEALILFTLEIARREPRLFDELLDWMLLNEPLLSVRRLRALCIDETDEALLEAAIGWLASQRPRARLQARTAPGEPRMPEPLFTDGGPIREADPAFAAAGLLRPRLTRSEKSQFPDLAAPINLAFRLRAILGVGIRAEIVRAMLTFPGPWLTAQALAGTCAYSKRNVHEALTGLTAAHVMSSVGAGGEQRYTINKQAWAALLQCAPEELPTHRDWPALLSALRTIMRWSALPEIRDASEYMRASSARQLLARIRPQLALAGIALDPHPTAASAPHELHHAIEQALKALV